MSTYTTAIGQLRTDLSSLESTVGDLIAWSVTRYNVTTGSGVTGTPADTLTPAGVFDTSGVPKLNTVFDIRESNPLSPILTVDTTLNIAFSAIPVSAIPIINNTAVKITVVLTGSGAFSSPTFKDGDTASLQPGEAVTIFSDSSKNVYFVPGIMQTSVVNNIATGNS
jgi:hypothetical protein